MRGRRCAALLFGLLLLPVHSVSAFTPLHMLAVQITDLKPGYSVAPTLYGSGYLSEHQVAFRENLSVRELNQHGWANDYTVTYQRGAAQIANTIDEESRKRGAHWMYTVMTGNTFCTGCYRVIAFPHVGNESIAGQSGGFTRIIFHQGSYVVDLSALGTGNDRGNVLALARLVASRIRHHR